MEELIKKISIKHFESSPSSVKRYTTGLANEVYEVILPDKSEYVFRLNKNENFLKGSDKYIPMFASLGIKVPKIVISDYSKTIVPINYQILVKIQGDDIGNIFESLSHDQLSSIAKEVATIVRKVTSLPPNTSFGWVDFTGKGKHKSWSERMKRSVDMAIDRGHKTGTLDKETESLLTTILDDNAKYFDTIKPKAHYDDIASKNVIIDDGKFAGLIDIDGICYGDYLESIGRIKADFIDRENGKHYIEEIEKELGLNDDEKKMVLVYALMNRIHWLTGNGIKFNENSSDKVDQKRLAKDKRIVKLLESGI